MSIESLENLRARISDRNKKPIFNDYISKEEIEDLIRWSSKMQEIKASGVHFVTKQEITEFPINTITFEEEDTTYFITVKRNSGNAPISSLWVGKKDKSCIDYLVGSSVSRMITLIREYPEQEEEISIVIFGEKVKGVIGKTSEDEYRDLEDEELNEIVMEIFNNTAEAMKLFHNIRAKEYENQQEGDPR